MTGKTTMLIKKRASPIQRRTAQSEGFLESWRGQCALTPFPYLIFGMPCRVKRRSLCGVGTKQDK